MRWKQRGYGVRIEKLGTEVEIDEGRRIEKMWGGEGMKMEMAGVSSRTGKVLILSVCSREAALKPVEGLPLRAVSPVSIPKK